MKLLFITISLPKLIDKKHSFYGYYQKEEEAKFIKQATFLNIYYPRVITHDTALSNRFYNSLLYKRPMIVTRGTTQGDYAEQYKVGVALEDCSNLTFKLSSFLTNDFTLYAERCDKLLRSFLDDDKIFKEKVLTFVNI